MLFIILFLIVSWLLCGVVCFFKKCFKDKNGVRYVNDPLDVLMVILHGPLGFDLF